MLPDDFSVRIFNRSNRVVQTQMRLRPTFLRGEAVGGPSAAEFTVSGPAVGLNEALRWLDLSVVVRDRYARRCWWGLVTGVTVRTGSIEVGLSLAQMANRVRVLYSYPAGDSTTAMETDWDEDSRSAATYGYFELAQSLSKATTEAAEALQTQLLDLFGQPVPTGIKHVRGEAGATVLCEGYWQTLGRRYWSSDVGKCVHMTGSSAQVMGWELTSSNIGFTKAGDMHSLAERLGGLASGVKLLIDGSVSNDGVKTVDGAASDEKPRSYTATTISFQSADDVLDSANGLGFVRSGTLVKISGSSSNSGWHLAETEKSSDRFEISPGYSDTIVDESAGPSITIETTQSIPLAETLTDEPPGNSITVSAYGAGGVAQSFEPSSTFTVAEIWVRLARVGDPTDDVRVRLCTYGSGEPGSFLETVTLAGSTLLEELAWVQFALGNTVSVSSGTSYFIQVDRTGAADAENYYQVGVDTDGGYADGGALFHDGTDWQSPASATDLAFQVWGQIETTTQIEQIVDGVGDRFAGVQVRAASGVSKRQWRDGRSKALSEAEDLVAAGTSSGGRLKVTTTWDGYAFVEAAETADDASLLLRRDGVLLDRMGRPLPAGLLPYGRWARVMDAPSGMPARISPIYVERAEYQVGAGWLYVEPAGSPSPYDFVKTAQG